MVFPTKNLAHEKRLFVTVTSLPGGVEVGYGSRSTMARAAAGKGVSPASPKLMSRRRGNPNWGKPEFIGPIVPTVTEFEQVVKRLRLTPQTYTCSPELRRWCKSNRNRCYIPEWLLQEWDLEIELSFGW